MVFFIAALFGPAGVSRTRQQANFFTNKSNRNKHNEAQEELRVNGARARGAGTAPAGPEGGTGAPGKNRAWMNPAPAPSLV
ncbi:hypothetical protein [Streptomyces sp. ST2-7A]|uniref:hypothetical protein n=1 Tax=Streptomyces sp. ST2-7A TaxID=2907214 RepID=UPI001F3C6AEC|nr:hypothetical protein [Streptomyces sp. ST2-7A]MCE7081377.1 hypothetical protein [Streptomyces sp. ST2-7A]